jgi:hypothetical protein
VLSQRQYARIEIQWDGVNGTSKSEPVFNDFGAALACRFERLGIRILCSSDRLNEVRIQARRFASLCQAFVDHIEAVAGL